MRALIVDDEPMPAKRLVSMINKYCYEISEVEVCLSPSSALEVLQNDQFDIVFLDVEMPEMTGFNFLEHAMLPQETQVIVTTAYEQYAIEAFNADAIHYLVKPIKESDLTKAIRKVARLKRGQSLPKEDENIISVFYNEEYHLIREEHIIRLEASKSYTNFITKEKKILSSKPIGYYEKIINQKSFFRCHNSHIINLKCIAKLGKSRAGYIEMTNEDVVPVSNSKKAKLEELIGIK